MNLTQWIFLGVLLLTLEWAEAQAAQFPPLYLPEFISAKEPTEADTQKAIAEDILKTTNKLRTDPKSFIPILKKRKEQYDGTIYTNPTTKRRTRTTEGVKAVDDAIDFLENLKAVEALETSEKLTNLAKELQADLGKTGIVDTFTPDVPRLAKRVENHKLQLDSGGRANEVIAFGSNDAEDIVIRLLIDDGDQDRAHRKALVNPKWRLHGAAFGAHKGTDWCTVIDFATGIQERKKEDK